MSSAFVGTPFGGIPKQDSYKVIGIFNTGFYEFNQNFVYLTLSDTLSLFEKNKDEQNFEIYLTDPMKAKHV